MDPNDSSKPMALSLADEGTDCRQDEEMPSNVFLNEMFSPEADKPRFQQPWLRDDWLSPGPTKSPFDFQKENQTESWSKASSKPKSLLKENQRMKCPWNQPPKSKCSDKIFPRFAGPSKKVGNFKRIARPPKATQKDSSQQSNNNPPQIANKRFAPNFPNHTKPTNLLSAFSSPVRYTPPEIDVHQRRSYTPRDREIVCQQYNPIKHWGSQYERPFPRHIEPKGPEMYLSRTSHIEPYPDKLTQQQRRGNEWRQKPKYYQKMPPVPKKDMWDVPSEEQSQKSSELSVNSWRPAPKRSTRHHDDNFQSEVKKAWDTIQTSKKAKKSKSAGSNDYYFDGQRKTKQRTQACVECKLIRTATLFSTTQLKKRKDKRKCLVCLGEKCSMCEMQLANVCFPLPAYFNVKYFPGQLLPGGKQLSEDERQELKCIFCMFRGKPELDWPRTFLKPREVIERYISSLRAKYSNVLQKIARIYQSALENLTLWPFLLKHWRSDTGGTWMTGRLKEFLISPKTLESTIMSFLRNTDYLPFVEDISASILSRQMPRTLKEKMLLVIYNKLQKLPRKIKMDYKWALGKSARSCKEHIVSNYLREGFEEADDLVKKELPCVLDNVIAQLCEFLTLKF